MDRKYNLFSHVTKRRRGKFSSKKLLLKLILSWMLIEKSILYYQREIWSFTCMSSHTETTQSRPEEQGGNWWTLYATYVESQSFRRLCKNNRSRVTLGSIFYVLYFRNKAVSSTKTHLKVCILLKCLWFWG